MLFLKNSAFSGGAALLLGVLLVVGSAQAGDHELGEIGDSLRGFDRCSVTDPTGTPLNIRAAPQGQVIATIENGILVSIIESSTDAKGKSWAHVADKNRRPLGWVYREFVTCF